MCHTVWDSNSKKHVSKYKLSSCGIHATEGKLSSVYACMLYIVGSILLSGAIEGRIILARCLL